MKKILLCIVSAVVGATGAFASGWDDLKSMNNQITDTNFIIGNHCSGTLLSVEYRLILTNNHCVDQYITSEVREIINYDGEIMKKTFVVPKPVPVSQNKYKDHEIISTASWTTDIVDVDKDNDLALLQVRVENLPMKEAATIYSGEGLLLGEPVFAVGNPRMLDLSVSKGVISSLNRKIMVGGKETKYYQMDARITGGSSGGALYTEDGYLVGVPAAAATDGSVMLAIPYTSILDLLDWNCYASVYDETAPSYDTCMEEVDEEVLGELLDEALSE